MSVEYKQTDRGKKMRKDYEEGYFGKGQEGIERRKGGWIDGYGDREL